MMRRMAHPGPQRPDRVATALGGPARRILTTLAPGQTLHDALLDAFAALDARHGALELLGGDLAVSAYHTGRPAPPGGRAAEYGPPIRPSGPVVLLRANGSFGPDIAGQPMLHIHGALAEPGGRTHGGHLAPDLCIIGPAGLRALLTMGAGFAQAADAETAFPLFLPIAA